jgi:hypothetical protein
MPILIETMSRSVSVSPMRKRRIDGKAELAGAGVMIALWGHP